MSNKIKIVLGIVAIAAVFSVSALAQYVHKIANQNTGLQGASPLPSADEDPDHDGLDNQQEVIWGSDPFNPDSDGDGFKDGEEVKSGHSPLIPGPNDLIQADNLTQKLSELTLYGLTVGALNPSSSSYDQALADIASTVSDSGKYILNQEFNPDSVQTIPANAEAEKAYFTNLRPLSSQFGNLLEDQYLHLKDNLDTIGNLGFNDSVKKYYAEHAAAFQAILDKGMEMKVPMPLKNEHAGFLSLVLQMKEISKAIASGDGDPLKASLAFDGLGTMPQKYLDTVNAYLSKIKELNLDVTLLMQ